MQCRTKEHVRCRLTNERLHQAISGPIRQTAQYHEVSLQVYIPHNRRLGDTLTLLKSINDQLMLLPEETTVYPGHGPATTIGDEKHHNPYL